MIKRAFDVGRSNTRVAIKENKDVRIFESRYKEIPVDAKNRYDSEDRRGDFLIQSCPIESLSGKRFVKGEAANYYKGAWMQADNRLKKFEQPETYINMIYALASDLATGAQADNFCSDVEVGLCIPCGEFYSVGADEVKTRAAGIYHVYFPLLDKKVIFKLEAAKIKISPEGPIALMALSKEKYKEYTKGKVVVVVDLGYGSFDITVIKNGRPVGEGARSFPIGGITLDAQLASNIERAGYFTSEENVRSAVEHGYITMGKESHPVGDIVRQTKENMAKECVKRVREVLNQAMMADSEVTAFCPIGRGFTRDKKNSTMSAVYTGDFKEIMDKYWDYQTETIDLSEDVYGLEVANVRGVASTLSPAPIK